jgi:hypothetical protein
MPKPKPGSISINMLAMTARDAYSRPPELIGKICLDVIWMRSKRGRTTIESVEEMAASYVDAYPQSTGCISIFLSQVAQIVEK